MLELVEDLGTLYPTSNSKHKARYGLYKCFCGNEFKAQMQSIKSGATTSCGCYQKQRNKETHIIHGLSKHHLHSVWSNMKSRILNINSEDYKNYGARGITICDEWKNDFKSFYDWSLANGYKKELTIDRMNNNGNYEPINCRWVYRNIQNRNRRKIFKHNTSGYKGVSRKQTKWRAVIGDNNKSVHIGMFNSAIEAAKAYDQYVIDNNLEHTRNFN